MLIFFCNYSLSVPGGTGISTPVPSRLPRPRAQGRDPNPGSHRNPDAVATLKRRQRLGSGGRGPSTAGPLLSTRDPPLGRGPLVRLPGRRGLLPHQTNPPTHAHTQNAQQRLRESGGKRMGTTQKTVTSLYFVKGPLKPLT